MDKFGFFKYKWEGFVIKFLDKVWHIKHFEYLGLEKLIPPQIEYLGLEKLIPPQIQLVVIPTIHHLNANIIVNKFEINCGHQCPQFK